VSIKIYADGADINEMHLVSSKVSGFTTNPTLCRKAGVKDFRAFAERALTAFPDHPISFEVFSDDFNEMEKQAKIISAWGSNVYVKIPVCNTKGQSSCSLVSRLAADGIKVNATAILCYSQIDEVMDSLNMVPAIVSVFAGRIADTGRDPVPFVKHALEKKRLTDHKVLWASPRQVLDVYTADSIGCDIITCTPEILKKLSLEGKNLMEYSIETVKMFHDDAKASGYKL